jgi:hypothetical protein
MYQMLVAEAERRLGVRYNIDKLFTQVRQMSVTWNQPPHSCHQDPSSPLNPISVVPTMPFTNLAHKTRVPLHVVSPHLSEL